MMMVVVSIIDDNEDDEDDEARLHEGSAQGGDCSGASPDSGIGKGQVRKYQHHLHISISISQVRMYHRFSII